MSGGGLATIAEMFRHGGLPMYLILLFTVLSCMWLLVLTIVGMMGRRIPAVLWWGGTILIVIAGCVGAGVGMIESLDALAMATPENRMLMIARGFAMVLNVLGFMALANILLGAAIAIGCALASVVGTREKTEWRIGVPAGVTVVTVLGCAVLVGWIAMSENVAPVALWIPFALFVSSLGIVIAGSRSTEDEKCGGRLASDRFTVGYGAMWATGSATVFAVVYGTSQTFVALESVAPEERRQLFEHGLSEMVVHSGLVGVFGLGIAALIAAMATAAMAQYVLSRTVLIDAAICFVAFLPTLAAFGFLVAQTPEFYSGFQDQILEPPPPVELDEEEFSPPVYRQ